LVRIDILDRRSRFWTCRYGQVRRQCLAEFQFDHRQLGPKHRGARLGEKANMARMPERRVAQPEQHGAFFTSNYDGQVSRRAAIASGTVGVELKW